MKAISVFIPCEIPTRTAQQKGVSVRAGRPFFYKKTVVKKAENQLRAILAPYAPTVPLDGPLCLCITLAFPWRKSERKGRIRAFQQYPIDTRPDAENLFKSIGDQMTSLGFWHDDGQLSSLRISKVWSDNPGITLNLASDTAVDREGRITSPEMPADYASDVRAMPHDQPAENTAREANIRRK